MLWGEQGKKKKRMEGGRGEKKGGRLQANDIRFRSSAKVLGILSWADHRGYRAGSAVVVCRQLSVTGLGLLSAREVWGVCVCILCAGEGGGALDGFQTKQQIKSWRKFCQVLQTKRHRYSIHNEVTKDLYCRVFEASANTSYRDLSLIHFSAATKLHISTTTCCKILSMLISLIQVTK